MFADFVTSLNVAVIVSAWIKTGRVVNVKDTEVAPAGTVTVDASLIAELLSDRLMTRPPAGAGLDIVIDPIPGMPPIMMKDGVSVSEVRTGGFTVSVADTVELPADAVMDGVVILPTACVVTVKLTVVDPAGTVTVNGTVAAELLLDRDTTAPPVGAGAASVTVPVDVTPPVTLVGFNVTEATVIVGVGTK